MFSLNSATKIILFSKDCCTRTQYILCETDSTSVPQRQNQQRRQLNWSYFMLWRFLRFPEFNESSAPFRENPNELLELPNHLTAQQASFSPTESGQPLDASYMEHGSLAYGADWCKSTLNNLPQCETPDQSRDASHDSPATPCHSQSEERSISSPGLGHLNENVVATCSFYDHALYIWTLPETAQWGMGPILVHLPLPNPALTRKKIQKLDKRKKIKSGSYHRKNVYFIAECSL